MKTLAISFIFLTTLLNVSIFNTDKLSEIRIRIVTNEETVKQNIDKCFIMNCKKEKTFIPSPAKIKPPTPKRKSTNFYNSSYKPGFVIVDPILTYSI
jgi:hypothetical protein